MTPKQKSGKEQKAARCKKDSEKIPRNATQRECSQVL